MGRQMAEYALERGYRRTVIYYARDEYGRGLANAYGALGGLVGRGLLASRGT